MHISFELIITFKGKMSLNIPENLRKYCLLSEDASIIDKFKCPVPGCTFSTRLGPGAVRMHVLLKADPLHESRYCPEHEAYFRANESELSMDTVRALAHLPYRAVSYRNE